MTESKWTQATCFDKAPNKVLKNGELPNNLHMPRVLGVIPARGGSKRLPRKNIRKLLGHPLIAYTIQAARQSKLLSDFIVSTEDTEIFNVAKEYDAPVPFMRPTELAGDEVRNIDVVAHAMAFLESDKNVKYDLIVLLQPTCPIRDPAHIDDAILNLWLSELNTAVSVKGPFKKRDPILKRMTNKLLEPLFTIDGIEKNEPFYLYNASIYAVKRDYFIGNKKLISDKQIPIVMDVFHSADIDTEADFMVAEAYLKHLIDIGIRKGII